MRFTGKTIAAICASAVLALPAPAAADGEDIARALAGIAAVAIIAKAIENRQELTERQDAERVASDLPPFRLGTRESDGRVIDGRIRHYQRQSHPGKAFGVKKRPLPDRCLRWVETGRGDRLAYGTRCLEQSYRHARHLPRSCETLVRTPRGFRSVFGARCLARDGWRVTTR